MLETLMGGIGLFLMIIMFVVQDALATWRIHDKEEQRLREMEITNRLFEESRQASERLSA